MLSLGLGKQGTMRPKKAGTSWGFGISRGLLGPPRSQDEAKRGHVALERPPRCPSRSIRWRFLGYVAAILRHSGPMLGDSGAPSRPIWARKRPRSGQDGVMLGPSWPMLGLVRTHVALCWPRLDARWFMLAQAEAMLDLCWPMQASGRESPVVSGPKGFGSRR